jgi:hypothetical protein
MRVILFLICVGFGFISYSQKKKGATPAPPGGNGKPGTTSFTMYSLEKRLSFYPFSQSSHIQIVSFGPQVDSTNGDMNKIYKLPRIKDSICFSKIDQVRRLTLEEIGKLSDILYNTCGRWTISVEESEGCWYPRNALILFDSSGKAFEYIEICFQCLIFEKSNAVIPDPLDCTYAFEDLQEFFEKAGVRTDEDKINND